MGRANHSINRLLSLVFLLGFLTLAGERMRAEVRVWEGTLTLPTYVEGPPDVNPPFDLFRQRSFSTYPYTTRENLTDRKVDRVWRTLNLENEYLKVTMLPDLGGRLYSCVDKTSGREMFYANPSIKYAQVAYRGAWVALGIEFNFPVSHNWVTVSPVDFAIMKNPDGSASIWVGNIDRPYGMMWRVAMTLHPGSSLLEQMVTLYNRSELRHRFYWWNTSSVESWDDSRIIYPMELTAGHGYADIDTWPVDSAGFDLSIPGNHTRGFVSRFAVGTQEPFMGVYNPKTNSGMVHFAEIEELPGKKIWSWGWDSDGRDWRKALSDNESAYLEVQAGLFRNQETYAFLEPQQFLRFHEYYMPVRNIGGFSRANRHAVVYLAREARVPNGLTVGINVNHAVGGGKVRIMQESRVVVEEATNLKPSDVFKKTYAALTDPGAYTVEILDSDGKTLLSHTEGKYDLAPKSEFKLGPQETYQIPDAPARGEGDFIEEGKDLELLGRLLPAYDCYRLGLEGFPESFALNKGAGRLGAQLSRYAEAVRYLSKAQNRVSNDPELHYYCGNAWMGLRDQAKARIQWEGATVLPSFRPAAFLQLAKLSAQLGRYQPSLDQVRKALDEAPHTIKGGGMEVALLRHLGETAQASERCTHWQQLDPPNSFLRYEAVKLGKEDSALWRHLAGDPERVLELTVDYMALGMYDDAVELLARLYPSDGVVGEPGAMLPQEDPLIAYYRGFCRQKLGESGHPDFEKASHQSTRYVFPNRPETQEVLECALKANPEDPTAHFLLGSLYMSTGQTDLALAEWKRARELKPDLPVLHRNLGMALLHGKSDPGEASQIFKEGMNADPTNLDIYLGMDQALSLLKSSPQERLAALESFPDQNALPATLLHKLALTLAECGRPEEADRLFANRTFIREEFGTNIREVYLEIQLQKALASARQKKFEQARNLIQMMHKEIPGLAFTRDGLDPFLQGARFQYYLGEIESLCGNQQAARDFWQKAAKSQDYRQLYFAYLASRQLGTIDETAWRDKMRKGATAAKSYASGGGHFPGMAIYAEGLLMKALGQADEGNRLLQEALYLPDKRMSHYLSRAALQQRF
ncbi:MAG TPA: DUF5107 domain-containing protein [Terriglobia bacterium]|nr:DUF5107 domain-containing protein [Terriglobia bacterium]